MYSFQNGIAVKEELQQLNGMFKMLVEIHEELENIDDPLGRLFYFPLIL